MTELCNHYWRMHESLLSNVTRGPYSNIVNLSPRPRPIHTIAKHEEPAHARPADY
jgi:hypothetical protein